MSKNDFEKNGFTIIKNAISPELMNFVTQYALFDEIQDFKTEEMQKFFNQVPNTHAKYADPAMESMLLYLLPTMEKETKMKLYPTYSYYRVYRGGDSLKKHKDKASCEISATLCFNYSYSNLNYSWPIIINDNIVHMSPGDLVIYRGIDMYHERKEFEGSRSDWHVQGFFHYVNSEGPFSEFKYDGRMSIGEFTPKKFYKYVEYL